MGSRDEGTKGGSRAVPGPAGAGGPSTPRARLPLAALACLGFLAAFSPEALPQYRGDEAEDRDWDYSSRYFLEVLSFRMPWATEGRSEVRDNAYRVELGSVVTDEFWLRQEARLRQTLADWVSLRFSFLQAEDFDSRFVRHRVALDGPTWEGLQPSLWAEVSPFKVFIDMGATLRYQAPRWYQGTVSGALVDAVYNRKAKDEQGQYRRIPTYVAHRSVLTLGAMPLRIAVGAEADLPSVLDEPGATPADGCVFSFRRTRADGELWAEPWRGWELRLQAGGEWAGKKWNHEPYAASSPGTGWFRRDAGWGRIEGRRRWDRAGGFEEDVTVGFHWIQLLETWRYPFDPWKDRRLWKRDFVAYAGGRLRLGPVAYLAGTLFVGSLEHLDHRPAHTADDYHRDYPGAVKVNAYLGLYFREGADIAILLSFEPDVVEFGGGGVTALITF